MTRGPSGPLCFGLASMTETPPDSTVSLESEPQSVRIAVAAGMSDMALMPAQILLLYLVFSTATLLYLEYSK